MDFRTIEMFAAICVIYLVLVLILSFLASRIEYRLNAPFRH
jgi:polar amino acid transport system permease protein